jgi:AraC-like DNA-binding protein
LVVDGCAAVRLEAGDLAFLPFGAGHVLTSDPALPSVPAELALDDAGLGEPVHGVGDAGEQSHLVHAQLSFEGVLAPKLRALLPPFIHIRAGDGCPREWLRAMSQLLAEEARNAGPGSSIMIARILDVLFVQALREWSGRRDNLGWLIALPDLQIGKALSAIHADPACEWTVGSLASLAGLSRSAFASRFSAVVGQPPLQYLTTWRLNLAADHLRAGTARLAQIASAVGYGSEAALHRAFKGKFGITPGAFRRRHAPRGETSPASG